jgi:hypothetical protein
MSIEITDEMVEIAHKAFCDPSSHMDIDGSFGPKPAMRAILAAVAPLMQAKVADGCRLTPMEPTDAMVNAALRLQGDDAFIAKAPALISALMKIYKAMLTAAPEVQS